MADDVRLKTPDDLYQRDFYAWTQAQAEALRSKSLQDMDWARLAEEIGDMGASDFRECVSRIRTILVHLYKLAWSKQADPRGGWQATILTQRDDLERVLTATLRALVEPEVERIHKKAGRIAARDFETQEPLVEPDMSLRWTFAQILGEENDPLD